MSGGRTGQQAGLNTMIPSFYQKRPRLTHERLGLAENPEQAESVLSHEAKRILSQNHIKDLAKRGLTSLEALSNEIMQVTHRVLPQLRDKLPFYHSMDELSGGEVELEVSVELEQHVEQQQEAQFQDLREHKEPLPRVIWDRDEFLSGRMFDRVTSSQYRSLNTKNQIFLQKLSASLNLVPNEYPLFSERQKVIQHILVVADKNSNVKKMVLLDREEFQELGNWLHEDTKSNHALLIYTLGFGVSRYNQAAAEQIDPITSSRSFFELIVQAKFFAGRVNFSQQERVYLAPWLNSHDCQTMNDFFIRDIVRYLAITKAEYAGSDLFRVFQQKCQ